MLRPLYSLLLLLLVVTFAGCCCCGDWSTDGAFDDVDPVLIEPGTEEGEVIDDLETGEDEGDSEIIVDE